jgi:hypothetical protein
MTWGSCVNTVWRRYEKIYISCVPFHTPAAIWAGYFHFIILGICTSRAMVSAAWSSSIITIRTPYITQLNKNTQHFGFEVLIARTSNNVQSYRISSTFLMNVLLPSSGWRRRCDLTQIVAFIVKIIICDMTPCSLVDVIFEVHSVVVKNIAIFWDIAPCSLWVWTDVSVELVSSIFRIKTDEQETIVQQVARQNSADFRPWRLRWCFSETSVHVIHGFIFQKMATFFTSIDVNTRSGRIHLNMETDLSSETSTNLPEYREYTEEDTKPF